MQDQVGGAAAWPLLGQLKHFTSPFAAIKVNGPGPQLLTDAAGGELQTAIGFEIFCTFIDFRFTDAAAQAGRQVRAPLSLCPSGPPCNCHYARLLSFSICSEQ